MPGLSVAILEYLRAQYVHERSNAFRYFALACWANQRGFLNVEKFFQKQGADEDGHAAEVYKYITERGHSIAYEFPQVIQPEPEDCYSAIEMAFDVEKNTTAKLKAIYSAAFGEADYLTVAWLSKGLLVEQIEEEDILQTILDRFDSRIMGAEDRGAVSHDMDVWIGETYLG